MKIRKWIATVLALCMVLPWVPAMPVHAMEADDGLRIYGEEEGILASGTCGENLTWTLTDDGVLTISGIGDMEDYSYPLAPWYDYCDIIVSVVMDGNITSIGDYAFFCCTNLNSVTIPDGVTNIDSYAFYNCSSLASVTIPSSVTCIGAQAFGWCDALTDVIIADGVTDIDDGAFYYCSSLANVTIPSSVTCIGDEVFRGCSSLTEVTIPSSVTTIGNYVFYDCESLTGIWVDGNNPNYSSDDRGVLFDKNKTTLIKAPCGITGAYSIPDGVTTISEAAFTYCHSLTSVTIPYGVTELFYGVFALCSSLSSVTIPDSVTSIGNFAFSECYVLSSVTIPASVTTIGFLGFAGCYSLDGIWVDPDNAYYCSDEYGVLYDKAKTTLIMAGNAIPETYVIPDSVTLIEDCAFEDRENLTSVAIPDGVTTLGSEAFASCDNLASIVIPSSVTSVGAFAFSSCYSLTEITFLGDAPFFDDSVLFDITTTVYYPAGNPTWTEEVMHDHGGIITWVANETEESGDVEYELPEDDSVAIPENDCFEPGTVVSVEKVEDGDTYETAVAVMEDVAEQYVIYEINATKDNVSVQPNGTFTITFAIPEDYSDNVVVYYMAEDGSLELLDVVVDPENRIVTVELSHFSTYILADLDSRAEPADLLGDVNGDGSIDTTDAKLVMQFNLGLVDENALTLDAADVNGDGRADTTDAKLIMQLDLGLITQFP